MIQKKGVQFAGIGGEMPCTSDWRQHGGHATRNTGRADKLSCYVVVRNVISRYVNALSHF